MRGFARKVWFLAALAFLGSGSFAGTLRVLPGMHPVFEGPFAPAHAGGESGNRFRASPPERAPAAQKETSRPPVWNYPAEKLPGKPAFSAPARAGRSFFAWFGIFLALAAGSFFWIKRSPVFSGSEEQEEW